MSLLSDLLAYVIGGVIAGLIASFFFIVLPELVQTWRRRR